MPRMTIFWLLVYCSGTLMSFVNPLYGTLTYVFEYYLRPSLHWWGQSIPNLRWNFLIAAVLTLTFLARRSSLPEVPQAPRGPAFCLLALAGVMMLVTPGAVDPSFSWVRTTDFLKLILFFALVVGTLRTERALDLFIAAHIAGSGWWGWQAFVDPERESGRLVNIGSGDTLGDNFAAAHLLTVLPFLAVFGLMHKDKRFKALALGAGPFIVNALILCNSRGSMVGLAAAALLAMFISRTGHRIRMLGVAAVLAIGFYALADPEFIQRQQTTTRPDDGSANERIAAYGGAARLVADHPFGAGGGGFTLLSNLYVPQVVDANGGELRDPHNTFLLVTSEWGIPGLVLLLGYYGSCAVLLWQVRRRAPEGGMWYYRSVAIQLAMVGIFVAGAFSDRLYAEAPYWMGALAVALHRLQTKELTLKQPAAVTADPSADFYARLPQFARART